MPDTDSELRREWKAAERQLSSRDEASRRAAEVRLDYLRRRWDDLVIRKQRGELTDATRTDELRRIIETAAKWHGLKTNQRLMEGTRNEFEVAERWSLYVAYTGDLSEFNSKRWQAF